MNRRRTLSALLAICVAPCAQAQPVKAKRVIVLSAGSPGMDEQAAFFDHLRRLGWAEGQNVTYERLYARGSREKIAELGRVAAAKQPDLIYAPTATAAVSATQASRSIPVVFATVTDPTVNGLVASLARPGGNATGTFQIQADLVSKRFEILREAMPRLKRVGVLLDARAADYPQQKVRHQDAGRKSGFDVAISDFSGFDEVPNALTKLKNDRVEAVTVSSSFTLISRRNDFMELTRRAAIPVIAHRLEYAEAGALITYGADISDTLRRTAEIVHRVLKGASPAETPVEQASKFELIVNLAAAKQLGISFPKALLARADRVIE
jgi:putative ABC transport system substrate-binding protein